MLLPCTEVLAKECQLVTEACCILACQVPPPPGLLLRRPGSCLRSLGSETTLPAYLQGHSRQRQQPRGLDTPLPLGTAEP